MKKLFGKVFGFILGVTLIFPVLGLISLFMTCKNYFYSAVISAVTFYLILGFTGVACFLTFCMTIIMTYIGTLVYKKGIDIIDRSMESKLNKLSEEEKTQRSRGIKIDDIIGRFGGLN